MKKEKIKIDPTNYPNLAHFCETKKEYNLLGELLEKSKPAALAEAEQCIDENEGLKIGETFVCDDCNVVVVDKSKRQLKPEARTLKCFKYYLAQTGRDMTLSELLDLQSELKANLKSVQDGLDAALQHAIDHDSKLVITTGGNVLSVTPQEIKEAA